METRSFATTIPGYPRVGVGRPYKKLLEAFWSEKISSSEFDASVLELREDRLRTQLDAGLDLIPCGDFSLYDHVLDTALMLGCLPERFERWAAGSYDQYFAMARGKDGVAALEMTKWFDTNYHYLVPELPGSFELHSCALLSVIRQAKSVVGEKAKPVVLGPFTFLKLARVPENEIPARLEQLVPLYEQLIQEITALGVPFIQVDEPSLVGDISRDELSAFVTAYQRIARGGNVVIQTYYGGVQESYAELIKLPIAGLGLDFVRGETENLAAILKHGFPSDKSLIAGVIDGRNIWRANLADAHLLIENLGHLVHSDKLLVGSSCSLLHLPETTSSERNWDARFFNGIVFAQEKLAELRLLADYLLNPEDASTASQWERAGQALVEWNSDSSRFVEAVQVRVTQLQPSDFVRVPYADRDPLQRARLKLPLLPTTTIGSFPQTPALRQARAKSASDPEAYAKTIREEIEKVIRLQEELGIDMLVHGEPERNDMVQFFGDQMRGFVTSEEGWVQSYGSRCVRPPIIYGDVERIQAMTVGEAKYAQSLTAKPVKGMLTGPVTILNWSFVREDISRSAVAYQIALAIRDEVKDLEVKAGLAAIQVDEPALREGLPLRRSNWKTYLDWGVQAFRLATAAAQPETQIHTHMCYSEFGDILDSIAALDADVISIEDARSNGAMLETLRQSKYPQQIGPGVYDIHSPNVPSVKFLVEKIQSTIRILPVSQVWVNPDCGLKTRRYEEVIPSLRNMVEAACVARESLLAKR